MLFLWEDLQYQVRYPRDPWQRIMDAVYSILICVEWKKSTCNATTARVHTMQLLQSNKLSRGRMLKINLESILLLLYSRSHTQGVFCKFKLSYRGKWERRNQCNILLQIHTFLFHWNNYAKYVFASKITIVPVSVSDTAYFNLKLLKPSKRF